MSGATNANPHPVPRLARCSGARNVRPNLRPALPTPDPRTRLGTLGPSHPPNSPPPPELRPPVPLEQTRPDPLSLPEPARAAHSLRRCRSSAPFPDPLLFPPPALASGRVGLAPRLAGLS